MKEEVREVVLAHTLEESPIKEADRLAKSE
jgi:hypothetical protein